MMVTAIAVSLISPVGYDYAGKYLLTLLMRADGFYSKYQSIGDISHPLVLHGLSVKKIL